MLWWTLRQLRSSRPAVRVRAVGKLARRDVARALEALLGLAADPSLAASDQEPVEAALRDAFTTIALRGDATAVARLLAVVGQPAGARALATVASAFVATRTRAALPPLLTLLLSPDETLRSTAAGLLPQIEPAWLESDVARALVPRLSDVVRQEAAAAGVAQSPASVRATDGARLLERLPGGRAGIPALVAALTSRNSDVRGEARRVLEVFGRADVAPALIQSLRSEGYDARIAAIGLLVTLGANEAVPDLMPVLEEAVDARGAADEAVQVAAARALGDLHATQAVELLASIVRAARRDESVQEAAAEALGRLGHASVVDVLGKAAMPRIDQGLPAARRQAMAKVAAAAARGWIRLGGARSVRAAIKCLADPAIHADHRDALRAALVDAAAGAAPTLAELLLSPDTGTRAQAAALFAASGGLVAAATGALCGALRDSDGSVRARAAEALSQLRGEEALKVLDALVAHWTAAGGVAPETIARMEIRDSRVIEPLLRWYFVQNIPSRVELPRDQPNPVIGQMRDLLTAIRSAITPGEIEAMLPVPVHRCVSVLTRDLVFDESDAAVKALCAAPSRVTSNFLHLVIRRDDFLYTVRPGGDDASVPDVKKRRSMVGQRDLASKELRARGNPPHDAGQYLGR
jgi:HEAT repeat protein